MSFQYEIEVVNKISKPFLNPIIPLKGEIWKTRDGRNVFVSTVLNLKESVIEKPVIGCFVTKENKLSKLFFSWSLSGKFKKDEDSLCDLVEKTNNNLLNVYPEPGEVWKIRKGDLVLIQEIGIGTFPYIGSLISLEPKLPNQIRWRYDEKNRILVCIDSNFDAIEKV